MLVTRISQTHFVSSNSQGAGQNAVWANICADVIKKGKTLANSPMYSRQLRGNITDFTLTVLHPTPEIIISMALGTVGGLQLRTTLSTPHFDENRVRVQSG
jgi:hypothetical protein